MSALNAKEAARVRSEEVAKNAGTRYFLPAWVRVRARVRDG